MPSAAIAEPTPGTFFARLTAEEREGLAPLGVEHSFPRGTVLMFEGEAEERLMLVTAGRVKAGRIGPEGKEVVLGIRDPGDLLGELAFIDHEPRSATVSALEPVRALVMGGPEFRKHLETTPRVAVALLEVVAKRFREATIKRLQFSALDTLGRLSARILELADRYGEPSDDGIKVDLPVSQEELASWAVASRAGVAQALQVLRQLGWIETQRRQLTVKDAAALRARAAV